MSDDTLRRVQLTRTEHTKFTITNARGGQITIGQGDDGDFTPVELLLAAIAGCSAIDVDFLTTKRAEPRHFSVEATGRKLPEHLMSELALRFDIEFGEDEAGAAAQARVPGAIATSHDRLCTVSRTVEQGAPVDAR